MIFVTFCRSIINLYRLLKNSGGPLIMIYIMRGMFVLHYHRYYF